MSQNPFRADIGPCPVICAACDRVALGGVIIDEAGQCWSLHRKSGRQQDETRCSLTPMHALVMGMRMQMALDEHDRSIAGTRYDLD